MANISFFDVITVPYLGGLKNAHAYLSKGYEQLQTQNTSPDSALAASLYPDMKPLSYQLKRCTDIVITAITKINPAIEPVVFADEPKTFPEWLARIEKTIQYLEGLDKNSFEGKEDAEVHLTYGNNITLKFSGLNYIMQMAHPNFWFHATTAYDILRVQGVKIGMEDFLNGGQVMKLL